MIRIYVITVMCASCLCLFAQPDIEWAYSFGGTSSDAPRCMALTSDGGSIAAGGSSSNDGDVSANNGGSDYWVVKLDGQGAIQWEVSLGGSAFDEAQSILQTADGGYIVAGYSNSIDGDVSGNHGSHDGWVVKLDGLGNMEWQKCLGGADLDGFHSVIQLPDASYALTGGTRSNDGDVSGNHGDNDLWLVELDPNGVLLNQKCFGGSLNDSGRTIKRTMDQGYLLAGSSLSNDGDVSGHHGPDDHYDMWVVKTDTSGAIQWQRSLGGSDDDVGYTALQAADGDHLVAGIAHSSDGDVSVSHGHFDVWLVRLDAMGDLEWERSYGGSETEHCLSIQPTLDGGFLLGCHSSSSDGDVTGHIGSPDYWLLEVNDVGDIQWQRCLGGTSADIATSAYQMEDGSFIIGGYARSTNGDVLGNHGLYDYWIVKLFPYPAAIPAATAEGNGVVLIPNPGSHGFTVMMTGLSAENGRLVLSDAQGRQVAEVTVHNGSAHVSAQHAMAGMYFYRILDATGLPVASGKWVKE